MARITIIQLKDWQPYLSEVPDGALTAMDYALKDKYGQKSLVTEKIAIRVEILEVDDVPSTNLQEDKDGL